MLKKSYAGFILWLAGFMAAMLAVCLIPAEDWQTPMRLVMLIMAWGMAALTFIVWRTEQVYWYNGTSYEAAVNAGSERRKVFAWKHFRLFGFFALLQTALTCGTSLLGWNAWIDFAFATGGTVFVCCCTIPIRL